MSCDECFIEAKRCVPQAFSVFDRPRRVIEAQCLQFFVAEVLSDELAEFGVSRDHGIGLKKV